MDSEHDFIPIRLLQHYRFCQRQCALLALDTVWAHNALTVAGALLHERVNKPIQFIHGNTEYIHSLRVHSYRYGLTGVCDVVLRCTGPTESCIMPIEYKVGMPKRDLSDSVQLCAQALCLEEMLNCSIRHAALFYGRIRRRLTVELDDTLRQQTLETIAAVRTLIESQHLPAAQYAPKCRSCSLYDLCQPKAANSRRVNAYLKRLFHPPEL